MIDGKVCVSVCAGTADKFIEKIKQAEEFADVIELRFDCLVPANVDVARDAIVAANFVKPLLVTFRSPEQGGQREMSLDDRRDFWANLPACIWAADLEEDIIGSSPRFECKIVSHHDHSAITANLNNIYERLVRVRADVVKIAVHTADVTDAIPVWKLLQRARSDNKQLIPIAMGDAGKWTRILGLAHGAFMTYAALETGSETAPGQITAKDLIDVYRVRYLDENTQVFGVIGDPVSHSFSPYMHNTALVSAGVNAVFIPLVVKDIDAFVRRMVKRETREVDLNFGGFSVTMPHKRSIIPHLDVIDRDAAAIGAVNTVKIENGKLTGYNTDAHGFIAPLKAYFGDLRGARVAIFGAGGAARACVFALKHEGADVTVLARDEQKARILAVEFDLAWATFSKFKDRRSEISKDFEILVNATPLGMKGQYENETLFTSEQLIGVRCVYDLVFRPDETPIIQEARRAGIPAIGGLEMLLAQGAKQFEIWTGKTAPIEKMLESVLARINHLQR